jgi:hypothetical protein
MIIAPRSIRCEERVHDLHSAVFLTSREILRVSSPEPLARLFAMFARPHHVLERFPYEWCSAATSPDIRSTDICFGTLKTELCTLLK